MAYTVDSTLDLRLPIQVPVPLFGVDPVEMMLVPFEVATENWGYEILLELYITVTFRGETLVYSEGDIVVADGNSKLFEFWLPVGAIIENIDPHRTIDIPILS